MSMSSTEIHKQIKEDRLKEEKSKKRKQQRLAKFLREHGEEIVEIEDPQICRGATTTTDKITRNELAQHQAFVYSNRNQKILMRLHPKKSKK